MKNLIYLSAIVLLFSCKKDEVEEPKVTPTPVFVKFSTEIMPILQTADCNNSYCHGSNGVSGIAFGNHAEVSIIPSSKLLGAIKHEAGYDTMPRLKAKLSNEEIALIEKWVNEGKKDN